ncbi:GDP-mannose 4,6-dehydratase [Rhizobium sp. CSW-27]|nr:GDP-mannose 4,6-dehydratase [Rhizobium sp. CSW-27]
MMPQHRILVTGANGFVGRWLMPALQDAAGDEPLELYGCGRGPGCDIALDIRDEATVVRVLRELHPTAIIHLAAIADPQEARRDPVTAWNVNFTATVNLARATLSEVPDCRFIYAGSSETYGQTFAETKGEAVTEGAALRPLTVYGATKAAADIALGRMYRDGLRSIRFRPFNHAGPGQTAAYVLPAFASQIARIEQGLSEPVIEVGNLSAYRDFLDVRDVVRAYALAALGKVTGVEGQVFNLSSGRAVQIGTILDILIRLSGRRIEVAVSQERLRPVDIPLARGNAERAFQVFGWTPRFPVEETIAAVLADWRQRVSASRSES